MRRRWLTAYHEAGHALVAAFTRAGPTPSTRSPIIPRGRALGAHHAVAARGQVHLSSKAYVEGQIAILMGGRIAEELTQDDITTGAGNDILRASELAHRMVCEWGMSDLGPLAYGGENEPIFLGRDFSQKPSYSEATAKRIDLEVERIINQSHDTATAILNEHRDTLERLAHDLLEHESLTGHEIYDIIESASGVKLERKQPAPLRPAAIEEETVVHEPSTNSDPELAVPGGAEPEPSPAQRSRTSGEVL